MAVLMHKPIADTTLREEVEDPEAITTEIVLLLLGRFFIFKEL